MLAALLPLASSLALALGPAGEPAPRVLFVRGADRSGGFLEGGSDDDLTEQLADITNDSTAGGNHGWFELAETLRGEGFIVEQMIEPLEPDAPPTGQTNGAPIPFETMDLARWDAIVLGSNNAVYETAAIDAIDEYVRAGGSVLFISDANFGSDWADAPNSDQQFLDRFGWVMQQDRGTYVLSRSDGDFIVPDHPILVGVDDFDGEGVSPIVVPDEDLIGVTTTLVVRAKPGRQTRNNDGNPGSSRETTPSDASLAVADVEAGRIAGHLDRNTFFNLNGAGTNINRFDNRTYAINLFGWLTELGGPPRCLDLDVPPLVAGSPVTLTVTGGAPGATCAILYGTQDGRLLGRRGDFCVDFDFDVPSPNARIVATGPFDANGTFTATRTIPTPLVGTTVRLQAARSDTCPSACMSGVAVRTIE